MEDKKINVLYLSTWYPNRTKPLEGIFVKKHAEAVAKFCNVSVLYITFDPLLFSNKLDIQTETQNDVYSVRIFLSLPKTRIPFITFLFNFTRYILSAYKGIKLIAVRKGDPDLIQVNVASPLGIIALILKKLKKIPYIVFEHASVYIKYKDKYEYKRMVGRIERAITYLNFKYADCVISVSDFLIKGIMQTKGINNKYYIVPNIVEIPGNVLILKKDKDKIKAVTITMLDNRDKNIFELITAFFKLFQNGKSNLELQIIGEGKLKPALEKHAEKLGLLNRNVFFIGYIPNEQISKYLSEANFFILSSKYETFSIVTVEAIANGIPVVVTKCGGPEEIVHEGQGIIVKNLDEDALVNGIEYMSLNWNKYNVKELWNYAKNNYSDTVIGEKLYDIYKNILTLN